MHVCICLCALCAACADRQRPAIVPSVVYFHLTQAGAWCEMWFISIKFWPVLWKTKIFIEQPTGQHYLLTSRLERNIVAVCYNIKYHLHPLWALHWHQVGLNSLLLHCQFNSRRQNKKCCYFVLLLVFLFISSYTKIQKQHACRIFLHIYLESLFDYKLVNFIKGSEI